MAEDDIQNAKTPNEVWKSDLLGRSEEADLLVGYIESLYDRPGPNLKDHGYTIAVDAGYGEGKTFFLKRLAKHLSFNHPVAYIDAWADDLADEPLVALLSTLKEALGPIDENPTLKDNWGKVLETTGHVSKVVMIGLAKRALGSLITHQAADFLVSGLGGLDQAAKDQVREQIGLAGQELADEATKRLELSSEMDDQIAAFESSKKAMQGVKASLKALVENLGKSGSKMAPIVIVIDELDRCRPTYAIKLLEEIKHLFDVPGIVFILGMHGDQLSHSVSGAYGPEFDGNSYLRRFINRRYTLKDINRADLIKSLIFHHELNDNDVSFPKYYTEDSYSSQKLDFNMILDLYAEEFTINPRELTEIFDHLSTSINIIRPYKVVIPYFLPLLINFIRHKKELVPVFTNNIYRFLLHMNPKDAISLSELFSEFKKIAESNSDRHLLQTNYSNKQYIIATMFELFNPERKLAEIHNYNELLRSVSRFRN